MSIIFNKKQTMVRNDVLRWKNSSEQIYEFSGFAGTGKSTLLGAIIEDLKIPLDQIAPMSFIGQMAIVMRMKGLYNARTIHSWLFNPVNTIKYRDGSKVMNSYYNTPMMELGFEPKPLENIKLMIIDEAGSVPMYLRNELESRGIKILATGDIGQLPPVGDKPAFLYDKDIINLDEIVRQGEGSNILYLAERARLGLPIHNGFYGDVYVINKSELTDQMIYNADMVLCGKNKTRDYINNRVRRDLLGITSDMPLLGERVICRKNNWSKEVDGINLVNGLCGIVNNSPGVNTFDGDTFEIDFKPNLLNSSFNNLKIDYKYLISNYEDRKRIKNNRFSLGEKFEFAYANTTHLSQGSEYANGIFIEELLSKQYHTNLCYTGITRFSNSLIYVKPDKKFF